MDNYKGVVVQSFTDLGYWQKAHRLYMDTLQDAKLFPSGTPGTRNHADQLVRCVSSIPANIAEGFAAGGTAEYCRYLTIARKSCAEAQNWYLQAGAAGYIQTQTMKDRVERCEEISRMIYAARRTLLNKLEQEGQSAKDSQKQRTVDRRIQ